MLKKPLRNTLKQSKIIQKQFETIRNRSKHDTKTICNGPLKKKECETFGRIPIYGLTKRLCISEAKEHDLRWVYSTKFACLAFEEVQHLASQTEAHGLCCITTPLRFKQCEVFHFLAAWGASPPPPFRKKYGVKDTSPILTVSMQIHSA